MEKKLIDFVLPGVEDVLASLEFLSRWLINEDFPTLDLPTMAISGIGSPLDVIIRGNSSRENAEAMNWA